MNSLFKLSFNADKYGGYLLVYFLLLFQTGWFFHENLTGITTLFLLLFSLGLLFNRGKNVKMICVIPCIIIFLFQVITWMFGGFPEIQFVYSALLDFIIAIIVVSVLTKSRFLYILCDLVLVFCIASTVAWIINMFFSSLFNFLPRINPASDTRFAFLTTIPYYWFSLSSFDTPRIQGIFWEPGAFQIFINLALIVNYYRNYPNAKEKTLRFIILLISLYLTYSTTGWICGLVVMMLYLTKYKHISSFIIPLYLIIVIVGYIYLSTKTDGYLYYSLYSKVDDMTNYEFGDDNTSSVRMESIIYPLRHIFENPFLGLSIAEKAKFTNMLGHSMLTCTPINYFSHYGIFCGIFCFWCFFKFVSALGKKKIEILIISLTLLISTSSEQLAFNTVFTILMLYGYLDFKLKKTNEKNTCS